MAIDHRLRIGIFPKIARCPISVQDCVFLNTAARREMGIVKNLQKIAIPTLWNRHWRFQNPVFKSSHAPA
jgi:hypothetical protein